MTKTIAISFPLFLLIGYLAFRYHESKLIQTWETAKAIEFAENLNSADEAYFRQSPDVAIWELEKFSSNLEKPSFGMVIEPNRLDYLRFKTFARLTFLYKSWGETNKAEGFYSRAKTAAALVFTNKLGDFESLLKEQWESDLRKKAE